MTVFTIESGFLGDGTTLTLGTGNVLSVSGAVASVTANANGTLSISPNTGAVIAGLNLSNANTWLALQQFTSGDIAVKGSSTGYTTLTSANASATNYSLALPSVNDTVAVLATAQTFSAAQTFSSAIKPTLAHGTLSGTTAGSVDYVQPFQGTSDMRFKAYFSGYENNSVINQTISFTTAFTDAPAILFNGTGLVISATASTLTITAPDNITTYTGWVIVDGF